MNYKKAAAVILAASMLAQNVPIYAAPKTMADGTVFDAEYYAKNNPDVVTVFGSDENMMYYHYAMCGKAEGRKPYADNTVVEKGSAASSAVSTSAAILALQSVYPEGLSWTNENNRYYNKGWNLIGYGCVSFAMKVSDAVYGANTKANYLHNQTPDTLQVGDCVKYVSAQGPTHWVVVTGISDSAITVCEGNYNHVVHWGRSISKSFLQGRIVWVVRRG